MADLFDNPMGLMGFEFVEFASPTPNVLEPLFEKLGFTLVARHRSQGRGAVPPGRHQLHRQPRAARAWPATSPPSTGPSACGMAFRVRDSHKAYARALELGAQPVEMPHRPDGAAAAGDQGHRRRAAVPDRPLRGRQVDLRHRLRVRRRRRSPSAGPRLQAHRPPDAQRLPRPHGVLGAASTRSIFNFREIRYFDIKGEYTGLTVAGDDGAGRQDPHPAERGGGARRPGRSRSS